MRTVPGWIRSRQETQVFNFSSGSSGSTRKTRIPPCGPLSSSVASSGLRLLGEEGISHEQASVSVSASESTQRVRTSWWCWLSSLSEPPSSPNSKVLRRRIFGLFANVMIGHPPGRSGKAQATNPKRTAPATGMVHPSSRRQKMFKSNFPYMPYHCSHIESDIDNNFNFRLSFAGI